jgi:hypothetical protein
MTTDKKLIRATYLLGLIPLTIGLSIFFSWWIGKAWLLTTFHKLENWGLLWILISIPLGLAGLLTSVIYLFKRFRTNLLKGLFGLASVLINIPVLIWILNTQDDIQKRAYVRIYNRTGSDFKSLTIKNSLYQERLSSLTNNDYQTGYFYPNYDEFESGEPEIEEVILIIDTGNEDKRLVIPTIYKGECLKVFLDNRFNIDIKCNS